MSVLLLLLLLLLNGGGNSNHNNLSPKSLCGSNNDLKRRVQQKDRVKRQDDPGYGRKEIMV